MDLTSLKEWQKSITEHVAIFQNRLYANQGDVLLVCDISNPYSIIKIAEIKNAGNLSSNVYRCIAANSKAVAVARLNEGLLIVDALSFNRVDIKGDNVTGVTIVGDKLYASCYTSIKVYDITTPMSPVLLRTIAVRNLGAMGIYASENLIASIYYWRDIDFYTLDGVFISTHVMNGVDDAVFNDNGNMFIASMRGRIDVLDVSATPFSVIKSVALEDTACYVTMCNNNTLLAAQHDLHIKIFDILDMANWVQKGIYDYRVQVGGYPSQVFGSGNYFALAAHYRGVAVVNVTNPASPITASRIEGFGVARCAASKGNVAFYADDKWIHSIDCSSEPQLIQSLDLDGRAWYGMAIDLVRNAVYIPCTWNGLNVVDISNPATMSIIYNINPVEYADAVVLFGNLLYVTFGTTGPNQGLYVYNASNPRALVQVGYMPIAGIRSSALESYQGRFLYMSGGMFVDPIAIIDTQNPALPLPVSGTFGKASHTKVVGDLLYAVGDALSIYSLANPTAPLLLKTFKPYSGDYHGVDVKDNVLYCGCGYRVLAIDVSDINNPVLLSEYSKLNGYSVTGLNISDGNLVVAADGDGIKFMSLGTTPPPTKGYLSVITTPVSGDIFVGGTKVGSGSVSLELNPGSYTVSYGDVAGYNKPGNVVATVVSSSTTNIEGRYIVIPSVKGKLHVKTIPVSGNIYLNLTNVGAGEVLLDLDPGSYTVSYGDVAGYTKPIDVAATVSVNLTTEVTGTYLANPEPVPLNIAVVALIAGMVGAVGLIIRRK